MKRHVLETAFEYFNCRIYIVFFPVQYFQFNKTFSSSWNKQNNCCHIHCPAFPFPLLDMRPDDNHVIARTQNTNIELWFYVQAHLPLFWWFLTLNVSFIFWVLNVMPSSEIVLWVIYEIVHMNLWTKDDLSVQQKKMWKARSGCVPPTSEWRQLTSSVTTGFLFQITLWSHMHQLNSLENFHSVSSSLGNVWNLHCKTATSLDFAGC